jgi:checkpoint serine/threonine-protein kinase
VPQQTLPFVFNFNFYSDNLVVVSNSYWNVELWKTFFTKMLNDYPGHDDRKLLQELKKSFQDYISSDPQRIKKLKELLAKQRVSLCSA